MVKIQRSFYHLNILLDFIIISILYARLKYPHLLVLWTMHQPLIVFLFLFAFFQLSNILLHFIICGSSLSFILCKFNGSAILILQMVDMVVAMVTVVPIGMAEEVVHLKAISFVHQLFKKHFGLLLLFAFEITNDLIKIVSLAL